MPSKTEAVTQQSRKTSKVLIIPGDKHPITPEMIDRDALFILKKLSSAGFSGYLVGGGVRDLYLGKKPKDFDISTDARPGELRKLFPNSSTIGRRFRLVQVFFRGGKIIEVSTLRSLSEHDLDGPEQVLAPNNTFGTLSEDAQRRDLTINSLFYEIENNTIIDYVDGVKDLRNAIVRMVGIPEKRIIHDPVRTMRAIRHSARNNFTIEKKTWKAICETCDKLALCPPSRLRDEILKDIYSGSAHPWFKLAVDSGIFLTLFPLYRPLFENTDGKQTEERLSRTFATIDRTNNMATENSIHRQPDFFFFSLILIPWAESRYQLFSIYRKGSQLFQISKKIREELNHTLGIDLNLRRSLRQEIVNLLTNLSSLIHHRKNNTWPKWLRKKSYFRRCSLFYFFYLEITEKKPVTLDQLRLHETDRRKKKTDRPKQSRTPKIKPAFSSQSQGGIFGFKK
jgi:poly(A) polymerase